MSIKSCCSSEEANSGVTVNVDVTRIVKYVCIASVCIVGIIFGTRCFAKIIHT